MRSFQCEALQMEAHFLFFIYFLFQFSLYVSQIIGQPINFIQMILLTFFLIPLAKKTFFLIHIYKYSFIFYIHIFLYFFSYNFH